MSESELLGVYGGKSISSKTIAVLGGFIVFLLGVLDGFINPNKCN